MSTGRLGGVAAALAILLAGCVTSEEVQLIHSDIRKLKRQVRQVREEGNRREQTARSALEPVLAQLESLQKEIQSVRQLQADFEARLERTQRVASGATGRVEESEFRSQRTAKELRELKKSLETRLAELQKEVALVKSNLGFKKPEGAPPAPPPPTAPPRTRTTTPVPPPTTVVRPPAPAAPPPAVRADRQAYQQAQVLLKSEKYEEARKKLQEMVRRFPTSDLADNAQYWIGETYYLEKRYDKAILEFDKVVINYTKGDRVPSALLKQGLSFLALGDKISARQLLTQLVKKYPTSEEAETARTRLAGL